MTSIDLNLHKLAYNSIKLFSLILFALFGVAGGFDSESSRASEGGQAKVAFIRQQRSFSLKGKASQLTRPDITKRKTHIRIRYKASYLDCNLVPIVILVSQSPAHISSDHAGLSCSLIFRAHRVSNLRGPPSFLA